jgi:hypothetical protein
LEKEMQKMYGIERGSCIIIIKCISYTTTRLATKLMACKFLRKCRKEEVPARVVTSKTQCIEGTMLSWAPYLLNLFLKEYKDTKDLRTKFHYSWLLIMIIVIEQREPKYTYFFDKTTRCHAT